MGRSNAINDAKDGRSGYGLKWGSWILALRLLFNYHGRLSRRRIFRHTVQFSNAGLDYYECRGTVVGTLIFIHGMAALGREDPRVVHLAESIASIGYRVLVPDFPSIRALEIRTGQGSEVLARLEALSRDQNLVPGNFLLMAVSFSTVFALQAACTEFLAKRISGLCLIGGYFDVSVVASFITKSNRSDLYARLLVLRNYYRQVKPRAVKHQLVLERSLAENIEQDSSWNPDLTFDKTDPIELQIYRMLTDSEERNRVSEKIMHAFKQDWNEYQSNVDFIYHGIPVFLIHGRNDRIIPSGESKRLARRLVEKDVSVYLCVTQFLDHGNSSLRFSQCSEFCRLLRGFAWFFHA